MDTGNKLITVNLTTRDVQIEAATLNPDGTISLVFPKDETVDFDQEELRELAQNFHPSAFDTLREKAVKCAADLRARADGPWAVRVGTVKRAIKASAVTSTPTEGIRGERRLRLSIGSKAARFRF
jgi:hypothetical protein